MFTGIIVEQLTITEINQSNEGIRVTLTLPKNSDKNSEYVVGDSIALNGICSTIVKKNNKEIVVDFMPETINVTTVAHWRVGDAINCESPVTPSTKLSGSIVLGHIDTVCTVQAVNAQTGEHSVTLAILPEYMNYVIPKGSITIDGVNLTIADSNSNTTNSCTIKLIPYTKDATSLGNVKVGDEVNVEFDYIAKVILNRQQQSPVLSI